MRYAVVIERAARNYSAYLPDVPGCVATGKTVQKTLGNLREALQMHFESMRERGESIPDPQTLVDYIDDTAGANERHVNHSPAIRPHSRRAAAKGQPKLPGRFHAARN